MSGFSRKSNRVIGDRPRFPVASGSRPSRSTWITASCPPTEHRFDLFLEPSIAQSVIAVGRLPDLINERFIQVRFEQRPIALPASGISSSDLEVLFVRR